MTRRPGLRRKAMVAASALLAITSGVAAPIVLVTEEEVAREAAAPAPDIAPRAIPLPNAPKILVIAPAITGTPLANPIRIELNFAAAADAEIDPATFRAYYGVLRIDLTERIVKNVKVEKTGLRVDSATIPKGSHRLVLRVADTRERSGEAELRFSVE